MRYPAPLGAGASAPGPCDTSLPSQLGWGHQLPCPLPGTPKGVDFNSVKEILLSIDGVKALHSLHIWALTVSHPVLSVHIAISEYICPTGSQCGGLWKCWPRPWSYLLALSGQVEAEVLCSPCAPLAGERPEMLLEGVGGGDCGKPTERTKVGTCHNAALRFLPPASLREMSEQT